MSDTAAIIQKDADLRALETPTAVTMSPWVVQGIIYELISSFFLANPPESMGYPFKLHYDTDKLKSDIFLDIAYNYNASAANKRPSIFISRGDCEIKGLTFGHAVDSNPAESETTKLLLNTLPINVAVIAAPVMMVELLADYTKQAFISFQQQIQNDFRFRRFRLKQVSKPQIYVEAKEYFVVYLLMEICFDEGWSLKRDDLKLKTVGLALFDALQSQQQLV